jgi:cytochrome b
MKREPPQVVVKVWDPFLRTAHWILVLAVAGAWLTQQGGGRWHEWLGYAALAIVIARLTWGWIGPPYARFRQFVRSPAATLHYARRALAGAESRYLGHNPLGACMIVLLLLMVFMVCGTGWLYTTDAYWGVEWVQDLHEACSDVLLALVALHVAGVALTSVRQRENLVAAMVHGRKRAPSGHDVA